MPNSLLIDPAELSKKGYISFPDIPVNRYDLTIRQERDSGNYTDADLLRIYRDMTILREFEHMLDQIKTQGAYNGVEASYPGPAHLSLGQESAAVGQAYLLDRDDMIFGSHRSHSEVLAKSLSCIQKLRDDELMDIMENFFGGRILRTLEKVYKADSVKDLAVHFLLYGALSELFARVNGFHMGMGGSMHMFFLPFGVFFFPFDHLPGGIFFPFSPLPGRIFQNTIGFFMDFADFPQNCPDRLKTVGVFIHFRCIHFRGSSSYNILIF